MSQNTGIEWADDTRNIASGCSEARLKDGTMDPACLHCYARLMSVRQAAMMSALDRTSIYDGVAERAGGNTARWTGVFRWDLELLEKTFESLRAGRVTFLGSMTDLWHEKHDPGLLPAVAAGIRSIGKRPLLKRPAIVTLTKREGRLLAFQEEFFPEGLPDYVWPGVTAGNQPAANQRVPVLLQVKAWGPRVVSVEPMTGAVSLRGMFYCPVCDGTGLHGPSAPDYACEHCGGSGRGLGWVITGGESGQKARPSHPDWFRALRDECQRADVPYLHKQNGEHAEVDPDNANRADVWLAPRPTLVEGVESVHTQRWQPGDAGAEAGRWSKFRDVLMRRVGKKAAGRLLDGRTYDARPELR